MEIILLIIGIGVIFIPLIFAISLLRDGTPITGVIGQSMLVALMIGGLLQALVGVDPHIGISLMVLPGYVGANFILLMIILALRAIGEHSGETDEQPRERSEYEKLLFRFEDQKGL